MKPVKISDLMQDAAADARWKRRLKILLAAGAFVVVGGIAAIGVTGYYLFSATTEALQSPAVSAATDEALAKAEALRGAITAGGCLSAIEASLDPARWLDRPITENLAVLKAGCLGAATDAPPLEATST